MITQYNQVFRKILLVVFFLYTSLNLSAQEDTIDIYDLSLTELMNIDVFSASKLSEPIIEVPVPVTVITQDMIESSGARDLRDLLITFVPGITFVQDHNEVVVAMRGVYASSQQKILIMLNGHRLNSRAYSSVNPDYGIALNNIKQIEVLRGPASSLYGNVALTAVINIITKSGSEVNGGEVEIGHGNFGQQKISLLFGKEIENNSDFLFWGNLHKVEGEEIEIKAEDDYSAHPKNGVAIIGGSKDMPSFDAGFVFRSNNLSLLADIQNGRYVEPFSAGGITGEVYNYNDYRTFLGVGPGLQSLSGHFNSKYEKTFLTDWTFSGDLYFDHNLLSSILIVDPFVNRMGALSWKEYSYGSTLQIAKNYKTTKATGNVIAGFQVDYMNLYDSFFASGIGGELSVVTDSTQNLILAKGEEIIYSGFFQLKHKFSEKLIFNLGTRYDNKKRHEGENVSAFSPRMAIIYIPSKLFDVKLSYSQSFVDAPYWYRYNNLASYKGSSGLLPEHLSSIQFTPTFHFFEGKINYGINVYYNILTDIIFRNLAATGNEPRYINAGKLEATGIENEFSYLSEKLKIRTNFTYQYAIEAKDYGVREEQIFNIPNFTANINCDYTPFYQKFKNLSFNITARYLSEQLSPIDSTFKGGVRYADKNNTVDAVFLVNAGVNITKFHGLSLNFSVSNLFDKKYFQGGTVRFPYPQEGRWYMINLAYKFRL